MARFRFKLEALLEQRRRLEKDRQRLVAEAERERLAIEQRLRACQRAISASKADLRDALVGPVPSMGAPGAGVDVHSVRLQAGASFHLAAEAQRLAIALSGAHRRWEAARRALLEAARDRKAVETLRDRRFEEWKREQARAETAAVDELVVMRAGRVREDEL